VEQISTHSPWKGSHARAGRCLKEAVSPWGAPCWSRLVPGPVERGDHARAGLLAGLVTPWRPTLEKTVPEGLHAR